MKLLAREVASKPQSEAWEARRQPATMVVVCTTNGAKDKRDDAANKARTYPSLVWRDCQLAIYKGCRY